MTLTLREKKRNLRKQYKMRRSALTVSRRKNAQEEAYQSLNAILKNHETVLSYSSFCEEFCMKKVNQKLAEEGKLLLPRLTKSGMSVYQVKNLVEGLVRNHLGIEEPNPEKCAEVSLEEISFVFVPAIAFDKKKHRIGYGGGYYDRFLAQLSPTIPVVGIGFQEQLVEECLPTEQTDIPLSKILVY